LADTNDWRKKRRSGWCSLEGALASPVWRVTGCTLPAEAAGAAGAGDAAGLDAGAGAVSGNPRTSGGNTSGPESSSPELCAHGATNADCRVAARGPVTRTMVSRQRSSVSALPTHLSETAIPPV